MQREIFRHCGQRRGQLLQTRQRHCSIHRDIPRYAALKGCPVGGHLAGICFSCIHFKGGLNGVATLIHRTAILGNHRLHFIGWQHIFLDQPLRIQRARARMLANEAIHERLGDQRFVLLVVAQLAEAHQVDHHILVELHAVIQRDFGNQQCRLGVIRIDMKNRRIHHLGHIAAIGTGARVARIRGGKSDLIVNDDMHRAAGVIAARLRHAQRFHHHALSGKCRIAMQ